MDLEVFIARAFADGLPYNEAAQLCLHLYCAVDGVPSPLHSQCNKDTLAEVFATLASKGFVKGSATLAALYGANFHAVTEKGHWVEVIASIFKTGEIMDAAIREVLIVKLKIASTT